MKIEPILAVSICLLFSCDPVRTKSSNENPRATKTKSTIEKSQKKEAAVDTKTNAKTAPKKDTPSYRVDYVIDGDTFWVESKDDRFKVRVLGIDCPEVTINSNCEKDAKRGDLTCEQQIPLGKRAKVVAERQLKNQRVHLVSGTSNPPKKDKYNRLLAYVEFENGDDYGLQMVKTKQCDPSYFHHPRKTQYGKP